MALRTIMSGLWGGPGGTERIPTPGTITASTVLKGITVRYSDHGINSFQYFFIKANGDFDSYGPWGGSTGHTAEINFEAGEWLTSIEGTYGSYGGYDHILTSLTFTTNRGKHGPFGEIRGTPFSFSTTDGMIVGFHARSSAGYIDAIGIYLAPTNLIM